MKKFILKNIFLVAAIILVLVFSIFSRFFETPENPHKAFIARQKFCGIVQKKYSDARFEKQQVIVVNNRENYIDNEFASELNVGDSVSKVLYELNATIYKKDGTKVEFDLLNRKVSPKR